VAAGRATGGGAAIGRAVGAAAMGRAGGGAAIGRAAGGGTAGPDEVIRRTRAGSAGGRGGVAGAVGRTVAAAATGRAGVAGAAGRRATAAGIRAASVSEAAMRARASASCHSHSSSSARPSSPSSGSTSAAMMTDGMLADRGATGVATGATGGATRIGGAGGGGAGMIATGTVGPATGAAKGTSRVIACRSTILPSGVSTIPYRDSFTYPARARMFSMTAMRGFQCTVRAMPMEIARDASRRIDGGPLVGTDTAGAPALGTVDPGGFAAGQRPVKRGGRRSANARRPSSRSSLNSVTS
jgi:hypothetical protein